MKKKIVAGVIAIVMLLTAIPQYAFAENLVEGNNENLVEGNNMKSGEMVGILSNGDLLTGNIPMKLSANISDKNVALNGNIHYDISKVISDNELDKIVDTLTDMSRLDNNAKYISVNVRGYGITVKNINRAISYIFNCSPELFYFKDVYKYQIVNDGVVLLVFELEESVRDIKRKIKKINSEVKKFDQLVKPEMSTEDIILLTHDYIASNVTYDIDGLLDGTASEAIYDIYGVFGEKSAVCQGYALAAEYLLNKQNIKCGLVTSKNADHAWNVVNINGKWYHMDVTWDDPTHDNLGRVHHEYLLIDDTELFAKKDGEKKKDYVTTDRGEEFDGAKYNDYAKQFWRNSKTKTHYYNNSWYYMDSSKFELYKYDRNTKESNLVLDETNMPCSVIWHSSKPGAYWKGNYSRVAGEGSLLYFSTPKSIFRINLADQPEKLYKVFNIGENKEQIFGLAIRQNLLCYVLKDSPNSNLSEVGNKMIHSTNLSASCKTDIRQVESTYKSFTIHFDEINLVYDDGSKILMKYQVWFKKNGEKNYKKKNVANNVETIKGLSKNTVYNVKVRPYYENKLGEIIYGVLSETEEVVTNPLNRFIPKGSINKVLYMSNPTKLQIKTTVPYVDGGKTTCQLAYKKTTSEAYKYKSFTGSNCIIVDLDRLSSYKLKLRYIHKDDETGKKVMSDFSLPKIIKTK